MPEIEEVSAVPVIPNKLTHHAAAPVGAKLVEPRSALDMQIEHIIVRVAREPGPKVGQRRELAALVVSVNGEYGLVRFWKEGAHQSKIGLTAPHNKLVTFIPSPRCLNGGELLGHYGRSVRGVDTPAG
jgi:hypothetical protein